MPPTPDLLPPLPRSWTRVNRRAAGTISSPRHPQEMRTPMFLGLAMVVAMLGCRGGDRAPAPWSVEEMEIPLYHSSTLDPESGNFFHVEYCAARLVSGDRTIHIVYRPIDFPGRDPGFREGDAVVVEGLSAADDYGALEGRDYWITDLTITGG